MAQITPEVIFTAVNIAQFFIAMIAIALSVTFFLSAKRAEKEASNALEGIKAQTKTLENITAKQLARLTKHMTEQKPIDDLLKFMETVKGLPAESHLDFQLRQQTEQLRATTIEGYIGSYYYSAVTNAFVQSSLPDKDEFKPEDPIHTLIKQLIDMSKRDFDTIGRVLKTIDPLEIQQNPAYSYYTAAESWAIYVHDSAAFWGKT